MKRHFCLLLVCSLLPLVPVPSHAASMLSSAVAASAADMAAADAEFARGQQLFEAGQLPRSLAVLRSFVQRYPDHPKVPQAYTWIGRIFTREQRYSDALLYLERIPVSQRSAAAKLLTGYCQLQTGKPAIARSTLLPLLDQKFSQDDLELLLTALAEVQIQLQQPLQALVFLQQALPVAENAASLLEQMHVLLQSRLTEADLEEATFMWQGTMLGQDAKLQLARRVLGQQQPQRAKQLLQEVLASSVTFPYWQDAQQLLQRANADQWYSRDSIGVLLPLSGRYASYGELVKRGLELALREHNQTHLPVRFLYRDTAPDESAGGRLVSSLVDDDRVMAIIGPLRGTVAESAARRAQQEMVPLVSLSQRDQLPELGDFIFRDSLTPQMQVEALADYAMATAHISYSVLYPQTRFGEEMTRLFVAAIRKRGGEIVDVVSYPEGTNDFREQIEKILWEDHVVESPQPLELDENGKPLPEAPLPELEYPLSPSHALFLPDYAEQISQLVPQLVFYGVKDVTLLGINGWNSPELIERAGRFLENAVFVDGFFRDSKRPEVQRFVDLYRQAYQDEPTILEAQAFDVANVLLQVMDNPEVRNPDDLRRELAALHDLHGVDGLTGFDPLGEAQKHLYLLGVKHNKVYELP